MRRKEHVNGTKHCACCDTWKPAADFHRNRRTWDGLHAYCRPCMTAAAARRYERDKVRLLAQARAYRAANPEKRKAVALKSRFGLTPEAYRALLTKQEGRCAICRTEVSLHVDHCHATGVVRGLLCMPCNTAIGALGDDPERIRRAAAYVEAFQ